MDSCRYTPVVDFCNSFCCKFFIISNVDHKNLGLNLFHRTQCFAQIAHGWEPVFNKTGLNTIFTVILVTIIWKISISQREHPGARSWFCQHLGIFPRDPSASAAQSRSNSSEHMAGTSYLGKLLLETPWEHTLGVSSKLAQEVCVMGPRPNSMLEEPFWP